MLLCAGSCVAAALRGKLCYRCAVMEAVLCTFQVLRYTDVKDHCEDFGGLCIVQELLIHAD